MTSKFKLSKEEKKDIKSKAVIYSCSKWENSNGEFCKIHYAFKLSPNTVSNQKTITTKWLGGRWESLAPIVL